MLYYKCKISQNKLTFPSSLKLGKGGKPAGFLHSRVIIILSLKIRLMTTSLTGERPPFVLLIFKAFNHCPRAFVIAKTTFEVPSHSLPIKEANVNWSLLILLDISSLRNWGEWQWAPAEALFLLRPARRWVHSHITGKIRCSGCFSALVLHESQEAFRVFCRSWAVFFSHVGQQIMINQIIMVFSCR